MRGHVFGLRARGAGGGGSGLPAWLAAAAVGEWVAISGTTHAGSAGDPTSDGRSTSRLAYCGAGLNGEDFILAASGGHGDYSGNEVTSIDLAADAPTWTLRIARTASVTADVAYYGDGRPASRHTYWSTHYSTTRSRLMLHRSRFVYGSGISLNDSNGLNLATNTWDADGTWTDGSTAGCRDANDNCWAITNSQHSIRKWTASTDTWSADLGTWGSETLGYPMAHDATRDKLFSLSIGDGEGGGSGVNAHRFSIDGATRDTIAFNASSAYTQFQADAGIHAGMDYVVATDRFYWYAGTSSASRVYVITPNSGTTWDMAVLSVTGVTPATIQGQGIFSRFRYVASLGGFVCMGSGAAPLNFIRVH